MARTVKPVNSVDIELVVEDNAETLFADSLPSFSAPDSAIEVKMLRFDGNHSIGVDVYGRYWMGKLKNAYAPQLVQKEDVQVYDVTAFEELLSRLNLVVGNGVEALLIEGVDPTSSSAVSDAQEAIRVRGIVVDNKELQNVQNFV